MAKATPPTESYAKIIAHIFHSHYSPGQLSFEFARKEIAQAAGFLGVKEPDNLGDVVYSFRYRQPLPQSILSTAPPNETWVILPAGKSMYRFSLLIAQSPFVLANLQLGEVKVPDNTPGMVSIYAKGDEQSLLAKIRYNRLLDIFTGVACYSLQNHLRTTLHGIGQVETDEIYVGIDQRGVHHFFPVQAKGGTDNIGLVQVYQDFALSKEKFPNATGHPIAAQYLDEAEQVIALLTFEQSPRKISVLREKHYRLVPPDHVSPADLAAYQRDIFEPL